MSGTWKCKPWQPAQSCPPGSVGHALHEHALRCSPPASPPQTAPARSPSSLSPASSPLAHDEAFLSRDEERVPSPLALPQDEEGSWPDARRQTTSVVPQGTPLQPFRPSSSPGPRQRSSFSFHPRGNEPHQSEMGASPYGHTPEPQYFDPSYGEEQREPNARRKGTKKKRRVVPGSEGGDQSEASSRASTHTQALSTSMWDMPGGGAKEDGEEALTRSLPPSAFSSRRPKSSSFEIPPAQFMAHEEEEEEEENSDEGSPPRMMQRQPSMHPASPASPSYSRASGASLVSTQVMQPSPPTDQRAMTQPPSVSGACSSPAQDQPTPVASPMPMSSSVLPHPASPVLTESAPASKEQSPVPSSEEVAEPIQPEAPLMDPRIEERIQQALLSVSLELVPRKIAQTYHEALEKGTQSRATIQALHWTLMAKLHEFGWKLTPTQIARLEASPPIEDLESLLDVFELDAPVTHYNPNLKRIYTQTRQPPPHYLLRARLATPEEKNALQEESDNKRPVFVPLPALRGDGCRAYREWGAGNFMSVRYDPENPTDWSHGVDLSHWDLGQWEFLMCKIESSKAFFISCGMASDFRDWLLPLQRNEGMTVAKYNSRLALAFSDSVPIPPENQDYGHPPQAVPDITQEEGIVMSDGCGLMNLAATNLIKNTLGNPQPSSLSAVQGRFGPYKGVWVLANDEYVPGQGAQLLSRESQKKFECNMRREEHRTLEILQCARAKPGFLHKDAIRYLLFLGLPLETLRRLQQAAHDEWQRESQQSDFLQRQARAGRLPTLVGVLVAAGLGPTEDQPAHPFLQGLLREYYQVRLNKRYRLKLDGSAYLMMVPDHTGTLEAGQVSIYFSGNHLGTPHVRGRVLVYRSPLQQLSDMQHLEAVSCPALAYLTDVIVFSTRGPRAPASMLSGGDYDGDQAWVIWNPEIVRQVETKRFEDPPAGWDIPEVPESPAANQPVHGMTPEVLHEQLCQYGREQDAYCWLRRLSTALRTYLDAVYNAHAAPVPPILLKLAGSCAKVVDAPKSGRLVCAPQMDKYLRFVRALRIRGEERAPQEQLPALFVYPPVEHANILMDEPPPPAVRDEDLCVPTTRYQAHKAQWQASAARILEQLEILANLPYSGRQWYQDECAQVMKQGDRDDEDGHMDENERIEESERTSQDSVQIKRAKQAAKYLWFNLRQQVAARPWKERVFFASFVYQQVWAHGENPAAYYQMLEYDLWFLFLHEFCRLKADAVSLRRDGSLGQDVLSAFQPGLHLSRNR